MRLPNHSERQLLAYSSPINRTSQGSKHRLWESLLRATKMGRGGRDRQLLTELFEELAEVRRSRAGKRRRDRADRYETKKIESVATSGRRIRTSWPCSTS